MRPFGIRRREVQAEQAARTRLRLGALTPRAGWVPRVPDAARELAGRTPEPEPPSAGEALQHTGADPAVVPGRHRSAAERRPSPLRALKESLPAGVRRGDIGLERGHALVIGLVIALGLMVTVMLTGLGRPSVTPVAEPASTVLTSGTPVPVSAIADERATPDAGPGTVIVHVAGKVGTPGIVELPAGSRVVDAVDAAGGADDGVDLSTLNLARVLVDGEQVAVGIDPLPVAPAGATGETAPIVNLNTASAADLETLPGIGPTLAANIIAWREENGRFTMVDELQEVSGIGPKKFEALADQVTV